MGIKINLKDKTIALIIVFFFITANITFITGFAKPIDDQLKPGMLTDD